MQKQNVLFIGFMGVGKTTYGKKYAQNKSMNFIDLDEAFEEQENMSVNQFFDVYGEKSFRKKEIALLIKLLRLYPYNTVISLGGGTFCNQHNIDLINKHSVHVVFLKSPLKIILNRLWLEKSKRPLIANFTSISELEMFIKDKMEERVNYYLQANEILNI